MFSGMSTATRHIEDALRAQAPEELFGTLTGTRADKLGTLSHRYRELALIVHPDRATDRDRDAATRGLVRVNALRRMAEHKIDLRLYGDGRPVSAPVRIKSRRHAYTTLGPSFLGDVCELFPADSDAPVHDGDEPHRVVLKVAQSAEDNDLLDAEARTLRALFAKEAVAPRFLRSLPELTDSMTMEDGRRANVFPRLSSHRALTEVREHVDLRDVVWIAKRLLSVLGFLHARGFVHGAVTPAHVMVHPITHGAVLTDLCYAVPRGEKVPALSPSHRALYPNEVLRGEPAEPGTDLFMAAKTLLWLLPASADREVRRFFLTCTHEKLARRPDDAWALHEELDRLMTRLLGKPVYRPLQLPE